MIEIDKKFLMENRTINGAWTRAQIEVLGIKYPPRKGWHYALIGKKISDETAELFKEYRFKYKKTKHRKDHNILFEYFGLEI